MKKEENKQLDETLPDSELEIVESSAQTRFAEESPLFTGILNTDTPSFEAPKKSKRTPLLFLLILVPVVIIALIAVLLMSSRKAQTQVQFNAPKEATASGKIRPELQRRLRLVEDDIENADPIEPQLSFPPLDFELNLEDASVRQKATQRPR